MGGFLPWSKRLSRCHDLRNYMNPSSKRLLWTHNLWDYHYPLIYEIIVVLWSQGVIMILWSIVWFLCLLAYQPSWVILCKSHPCRRTAVVLFNPLLGGKGISPKVKMLVRLEFELALATTSRGLPTPWVRRDPLI